MARHDDGRPLARLLERSPPRVGPFRILAPLGEGGFAPVFLAAEEYGGKQVRSVALKLFAWNDIAATEGTSTTVARDRIVEEARALCRVEHPNVVRFLQIAEDHELGILALAMEHVEGESLATRIGREPLSITETLTVGSAIAGALASVHAVGLVHRDVKPGNVIAAAGVYKLIDFGIATRAPARRGGPRVSLVPPDSRGSSAATPSRAVIAIGDGVGDNRSETRDAVAPDQNTLARTMRATEDDGTGTDQIAGTMGYIDPSCLSGREQASVSSDLYALGATLYECVTGRLPSSHGPGESVSRLVMEVALGLKPPPKLADLAPNTPPAFAHLVDSLVDACADRRPRRAEGVASELERLLRVSDGRPRELPDEGPFRGLAPFDARSRDVFLGRATDVSSALEVLRGRSLLALVGASGSGKSSLARAGVLPAVVEGALGAWPARFVVASMSPGTTPKRALVDVLFALRAGRALPDDPETLFSELTAYVDATSTGLLLYVDALEELVTCTAGEDRRYLATLLAAIASRPTPGMRAVVTVRRDLLDPLLAMEELGPALARSVQLVAPLTAATWIEVVSERLELYGYRFESAALRDEVARQLAEVEGAMPLVEFALASLWTERDEDRCVIHRAALDAMGGLAGALAQHADATVDALLRAHGNAAAPRVRTLLLSLTTPLGTRATRRKRDLVDSADAAAIQPLLEALQRARLIVVEDDSVKLAHDVLVSRWPRLRTWVEEERHDRLVHRDVEEAAARWHARPGADLLLRGRALAEARRLERKGAGYLSVDASLFVRASQRFALRSSAGIIALASSVFVAALVLGVLYLDSVRETERRAKELGDTTQKLLDARNQPVAVSERQIEALVVAKTTCEKALARCAPIDAGAGTLLQTQP